MEDVLFRVIKLILNFEKYGRLSSGTCNAIFKWQCPITSLYNGIRGESLKTCCKVDRHQFRSITTNVAWSNITLSKYQQKFERTGVRQSCRHQTICRSRKCFSVRVFVAASFVSIMWQQKDREMREVGKGRERERERERERVSEWDEVCLHQERNRVCKRACVREREREKYCLCEWV